MLCLACPAFPLCRRMALPCVSAGHRQRGSPHALCWRRPVRVAWVPRLPPSCCAPPLSRWTAAPSPPSPCRKNWLPCFPLLPAITPLCLHMQVSQLHHWCVRRLQPSHVDVAQGCVCVCGCVRESVGVCGCLICGGGVWVGSSCGCAFGSMTA